MQKCSSWNIRRSGFYISTACDSQAFDALGLERSGITAVTMPCFGTTDRTYQNACKMSLKVGATLREVRIGDAVMQHFKRYWT